MSSWTPVDRANRYGLKKPAVILLFYVTAWFNNKSIAVHDRTAMVATDYEPTLRQLCGDDWKPAFDDVHDHLIDRGLFKSADRDEDVYVAGQRCRWVPTEDCLQIIEYIFKDEEQLYPDWILDEHPRPPTFRDGSELLEHRKGAMAAKHLFGNLERITSVDTYPRIDVPQRPDLRLSSHGDQLARVEVLTNHRNSDSWESKFETWSVKEAGPTIWLYENRENMVRFWNHLIDHDLLDLDGGRFGGRPQNWSPRRVNDRLRRSRTGRPNYTSHDAVWTIPGVATGDHVDAFELLKRNNIILQS